MKTLYENKFNTIYFDIEKSLVKMVRHEACRKMTEEEYKVDMLKLKDIVIETNAKYGLIDNLFLYFIITPDLQDWANREVVAPAFRNSLKKVAFIEGEDLFANISSQQTMEDNDQIQAPFRYFDNEKDAIEWLFKI